MKQSSEKTRLLFVFSVISAVSFLIGLVITFSLPAGSFIYNGLERAVLDISKLNSNSEFSEKIGVFISSYFDEIKLLLFAFLSCFSIHRSKLFIGVCAFKGITSGIGCGLFLRTLPYFEHSEWLSFLSAIIFVTSTVGCVLFLIYFCVKGSLFSKRVIYPIKFLPFLKRKDTRLFILDLLAFCGALIVILLLKIGNLFIIIS